ncbi:MAG: Uma2 family endonuclease [Bacteroidota bacterium]
MKSKTQSIPKELIYEMDDGTPIYFAGYRDFLSGDKSKEEVMGSSFLQAKLISRIVHFLIAGLVKKYIVLSNEVGLQIKKNTWRVLDIAVIDLVKVDEHQAANKYLNFPPELVVEVDTKAALNELSDPNGYFHAKTDALLGFGVQKVVWVFTHSQKVMIAEPNRSWQIVDWKEEVLLINNLEISIQGLSE